jgi:hypothetical protein
MKTQALIILLFLPLWPLKSQTESPFTRKGISFAKQTDIFEGRMIKEVKFGRFYYSFNKTYFMDNNLRLNNRKYLPTGFLFYKFEKYCREHNIYFNKAELKRFRMKSILAGGIFGLYATCYVPIIIYAAFYSPYNCPQCFYSSPVSIALWTLPAVEAITSGAIRAKAERRLKEKIFTFETDTLSASTGTIAK